jgi:hypothetical protein
MHREIEGKHFFLLDSHNCDKWIAPVKCGLPCLKHGSPIRNISLSENQMDDFEISPGNQATLTPRSEEHGQTAEVSHGQCEGGGLHILPGVGEFEKYHLSLDALIKR